MFAKGHPGGADYGRIRNESYPPRGFTFQDAKREVWTTAVYSLALIRWLTRLNFQSVFATTANYFFAEHQNRDVEDFGALMLTLEGGVTATLTAARIGWRSHPSSGPNLVRLYGSAGSALIDAHQPRFVLASATDQWTTPARDPQDPMGFWRSTQVRAAIPPKPNAHGPAFEPGEQAQVSASDGAAATDALLGAYESAATGKLVELRGV
jgi:predicted dehydrogenase